MPFPRTCFARSFRHQQQTQTGCHAPIPRANEVIFIVGQVCFGAHDACCLLRERARARWDNGTLVPCSTLDVAGRASVAFWRGSGAGQVTCSESDLLIGFGISPRLYLRATTTYRQRFTFTYCFSSISRGHRVTPERRCTSHIFSMSTTHQDLEGGNNSGMCFITHRFHLSSPIS